MPTKFAEQVYKIVATIPAGKTMTYQQVAIAIGSPKACRAVGNILNKNHNPLVPCHRVIRSDGKTGGYNRGSSLKQKLLQEEKSHCKIFQGE